MSQWPPEFWNLKTSDQSLRTIEHGHGQLHAGKLFHHSNQSVLAQSAVYNLHVVVPASCEPHLTFGLTATAATTVRFFEAPSINAATMGTSVVAYNRNRRSSTAAAMAILHTPTSITANGTQLGIWEFGATTPGFRAGGAGRDAAEWELQASKAYLLIIASGANTNTVNWALDWYEE